MSAVSFAVQCVMDAAVHRSWRDEYLERARSELDAKRRRSFVEMARERQKLFLANLVTARVQGVR